MKITWIGQHEDVKGDVEFMTENGERITLTAKEIRQLYIESRLKLHE